MMTSAALDSRYPNLCWEQFKIINDAKNSAFEEMCRAIFQREYVKDGFTLQANPNNPGIEVEPVPSRFGTIDNPQYISFQAKFFDREINYSAIKESMINAVKYYRKRLNIIYLFCNLQISTKNRNYKSIESILKEANIELRLITDKEIFRLLIKHPDISAYYFRNRIRGKEEEQKGSVNAPDSSIQAETKKHALIQVKSLLSKRNITTFMVILCIAVLSIIFLGKNKRTILTAQLLMPLSTRSGPSLAFDEPGGFYAGNWENQTVQAMGKHWENEIWWVLIDFTYNNQARYRIWTGSKRVNVDITQLDEIKRMYTGVVLPTHDTYRGPGTDYAKAEIDIPDTTAVDVYGRENGFTEIEFEQNGQKHRLWVPDWQVDAR